MRFSYPFDYLSTNWHILCKRVKDKPCRFCNKTGQIKNHGFLKGVHPVKPHLESRGIRFLCSNRYSNKGCGRSFSTLFNHLLPNHTSRTKHLKAFFDNLLKVKNVHAAWYQSSVPFSIRTAYRWFNKLKMNQAIIRSNIQHIPPNHLEKAQAVHLTTIELIKNTYPHSEDYICSYHQQHQTPFFFAKKSTFSS